MTYTSEVHGFMNNKRVKIIITNPVQGDIAYAKRVMFIVNMVGAFPLKHNMEFGYSGTDWLKRFTDSFPSW